MEHREKKMFKGSTFIVLWSPQNIVGLVLNACVLRDNKNMFRSDSRNFLALEIFYQKEFFSSAKNARNTSYNHCQASSNYSSGFLLDVCHKLGNFIWEFYQKSVYWGILHHADEREQFICFPGEHSCPCYLIDFLHCFNGMAKHSGDLLGLFILKKC